MLNDKLIQFLKKYYFVQSCLFTIGLFKDRSIIHRLYDYLKLLERVSFSTKELMIIPKIELSKIAPAKTPIRLTELLPVDGNASVFDLVAIIKLINARNPKKLFEIGTFDGRTALNMALNCSEESLVYTLDLPLEEFPSTKLPTHPTDFKYKDTKIRGSRYRKSECESKIVQLYGDSATFDFSPYYNTIDLIFIDGSHSYEYVMNDSKQAFRMLRDKKGVILWDDYGLQCWDGVTRSLNELFLNDKAFEGLRRIEGTDLVCLINQ